jgi:hypothetical protein
MYLRGIHVYHQPQPCLDQAEGTYLKSIGGPIIPLSTFLFLNPSSILDLFSFFTLEGVGGSGAFFGDRASSFNI